MRNKTTDIIKTFLKKFILKKYYLSAFTKNLPGYSYHFAGKNFQTSLTAAVNFEEENNPQALEFIKKIYIRTKNNIQNNNEDLWQKHINSVNGKLLEYLNYGKDADAFEYLNNMFVNGATGGFATYGYFIDSEIPTNKKLNRNLAAFYMDSLINLAEYLGVISTENIEQQVWGESLNYNADDVLDKIETKLGFKIVFPKFRNGMQAIKTKRGFFNNRDMFYIYVALKVKELCKDINSPSICEIGGGIGLLGYYLDMMNVKDFTSVDIIPTSLFSVYFLMQNMKSRQFTDFDSKKSDEDKDSIKMFNPDDFFNITNKKFDLIINCDSFPEINKSTVTAYLGKISVLTDKFFSINQEAAHIMFKGGPKQNIVHELVSEISKNNCESGREFHNISRNLSWIRRGYVEELYEIK